MRRTCLSLAAIVVPAMAACFAPSSATAFESYTVAGVGAGGTLVLRAEPEEGGKPSDWKELARVPGAEKVLGTGRSKLIGAQRWAEVVFGSVRGWANARYLAAADEPVNLEQATFACSGTEPFWGVTLGPSGGDYSDPEQKFEVSTERVQPATARLFPLLYRLKDGQGRSYRATVSHRESCIDGMSDYEYAFEVLWSGDDNFEQGCCVLQR